jgi:hypothetical protein
VSQQQRLRHHVSALCSAGVVCNTTQTQGPQTLDQGGLSAAVQASRHCQKFKGCLLVVRCSSGLAPMAC